MSTQTRREFIVRSIAGGIVGTVLLCSCGSPKPTSVVKAPTPRPTPTESKEARLFLAKPTPGATQAPATTPIPAATAPTPSATGTPVATPAAARQPNVLLVTIDTLRADHIGAYGFAAASTTPTLDRIASEGVRCDYALCQLPQTNASHAALLTGLYPSTNGLKVHMVDHIRPGVQTMAEVFLAAGYQTAGIYSWVSLDPQFCGLNRGFETYKGYVLNRSLIFSNPSLEKLSALYRQIKADVPVVSAADAAIGTSEDIEASIDGRADVTNAAVFDWLDSNVHPNSKPFFLWVHYFDPHYPYSPPAGYDHVLGLNYTGTIDGSVQTIHEIENHQLSPTPADIARLLELYQGEIAFTDFQLGRLLTKLEDGGILDDTIVVVTGDHGESFGEHDDWTHGLKVFEPEVRVPLLLRYPRLVPAGVVVEPPVQSIDVMPTLLDLTGIKAAQSVQGVSLLPVLNGSSNGSDRIAFTELANEAFVSMLSFQEWKLIRNNANGQLQLYHVTDDAAEATNLVSEQPQLTNDLSARLQELMKYSGVSS